MNQNSTVTSCEALGCFGEMFPDCSRVSYNRKSEGAAFDVLVESVGIGVQRKTATFKPEGWARCAASPRFDECYRVSLAKLLLSVRLERFG